MSRTRTTGDGHKCGCGKPAVWSGFCQMEDGKGYCNNYPPTAIPQRRDPTAYFNFGFTASLCGESTAYCPYPKGSDESLSWQRGYDEAEYATRS